MRHVVLGAGGVGGLIAAALSRSGRAVTIVVRDGGHPRRLVVESAVLGNFETDVEVAREVPAGADVLWVTVKSQHLEQALKSAPPALLAGAQVVPLLNGFEHVTLLRRLFGGKAVTPGTIVVESERVAPGRIRQLSPVIRVQLAGDGAVPVAAELTAAGIDASVAADERTMLWLKLSGLASIALTTTSLQAPLGAVRADPVWRARLLALPAEIAAVAAAEGATVDVEFVRRNLLAMPDGMRSSMQKDRAAGQPLEIDAIAGAIQRSARRHGLPTPVLDELAANLT